MAKRRKRTTTTASRTSSDAGDPSHETCQTHSPRMPTLRRERSMPRAMRMTSRMGATRLSRPSSSCCTRRCSRWTPPLLWTAASTGTSFATSAMTSTAGVRVPRRTERAASMWRISALRLPAFMLRTAWDTPSSAASSRHSERRSKTQSGQWTGTPISMSSGRGCRSSRRHSSKTQRCSSVASRARVAERTSAWTTMPAMGRRRQGGRSGARERRKTRRRKRRPRRNPKRSLLLLLRLWSRSFPRRSRSPLLNTSRSCGCRGSSAGRCGCSTSRARRHSAACSRQHRPARRATPTRHPMRQWSDATTSATCCRRQTRKRETAVRSTSSKEKEMKTSFL
mmetsp:Transcript_22950/g.56727  ORF Transcript_22950/g.56727 Transcript_22950/m.56727 type:complete len:338 (-) Transcript_22950:241-1254(-)